MIQSKPRIFLLPISVFLLTLIFYWTIPQIKSETNNNTQDSMRVTFKNVENDVIKKSFLKVMERYDALHDYDVVLNQQRVKASTMQAQPKINLVNLFTGVKKYEIKLGVYVRDSEDIAVAELPEDVLTGWFAHELGHLVDYESRSNFMMAIYGIRYVISAKFKRKVEHEADYIAIANGFKDEILATKAFILDHELLEESYKEQIRKYYLSTEEVHLCEENEPLINPKLDI